MKDGDNRLRGCILFLPFGLFSNILCVVEIKDDNAGKPDGNNFKLLPLAFELGYTIAIPLVFFALLGKFVDKLLGTSPILLLAGILLSILASSFLVYRKMKEILK